MTLGWPGRETERQLVRPFFTCGEIDAPSLGDAELIALRVAEGDPGMRPLLLAVRYGRPFGDHCRHDGFRIILADPEVEVHTVLHGLRLGYPLEEHAGRSSWPLGVANGRSGLPDEDTAVGGGVVVSGVTLSHHPPDELLIARLGLPLEGVSPPIGKRMWVG